MNIPCLLLCAVLATACGADTAPISENKCNQGIGAGLTCDHYCTTFLAACNGIAPTTNFYATKADCMNVCATLSQDAICCRAYHADLARMANSDVHCPHAAGQQVCP